MVNGIDFCTACGATVGENSLFCPSCGAPIEGRGGEEAIREAYKEVSYRNVVWVGIFLLAASIPSIVMGLYMIIDNTAAAQIMIDIYDMVNINASDMAELIRDTGIIPLAVGLLGVAGAVLCFMHRYWWAVLVITIVVLFVGVSSLIGTFLGFLALWFVLSSRNGFDSGKEDSTS